jgi:hypothetical protein
MPVKKSSVSMSLFKSGIIVLFAGLGSAAAAADGCTSTCTFQIDDEKPQTFVFDHDDDGHIRTLRDGDVRIEVFMSSCRLSVNQYDNTDNFTTFDPDKGFEFTGGFGTRKQDPQFRAHTHTLKCTEPKRAASQMASRKLSVPTNSRSRSGISDKFKVSSSNAPERNQGQR